MRSSKGLAYKHLPFNDLKLRNILNENNIVIIIFNSIKKYLLFSSIFRKGFAPLRDAEKNNSSKYQ